MHVPQHNEDGNEQVDQKTRDEILEPAMRKRPSAIAGCFSRPLYSAKCQEEPAANAAKS
jgi:hypothetical protein